MLSLNVKGSFTYYVINILAFFTPPPSVIKRNHCQTPLFWTSGLPILRNHCPTPPPSSSHQIFSNLCWNQIKFNFNLCKLSWKIECNNCIIYGYYKKTKALTPSPARLPASPWHHQAIKFQFLNNIDFLFFWLIFEFYLYIQPYETGK